jgi:hypothetical protein
MSSASATAPIGHDHIAKIKTCDQLESALEGGLGDTVSAHERMILHYYRDVQEQADQSFRAAKTAAWVGFGVLIMTLVYSLVFDALAHFDMLDSRSDTTKASAIAGDSVPANLRTVGGIGVVSGVLIEFIAGINFWLYGRAAKQFGAFHICLERTHRYLIAYKMCEEMAEKKDDTLRDLVCIMANAPMITAIESSGVSNVPPIIGRTQNT